MFSFLLVMAYFGAVALLSWGAGIVIKHTPCR